MSETKTEVFSLQSVGRSVRKPQTLISSVGGFSDLKYKAITSLQDLLKAIQPLQLELFEGSDVPEVCYLDEGASYRVSKCVQRRSGTAVAVKQVKLPRASTDFEAFQSRVACVLKDIEVMNHAPHARCEYIIDLLGYGWRLQSGSIPFLVVELAPLGTLRDYLVEHHWNLNEGGWQRLKLCRNVLSGLEELHLSGVVHGDLKLDNVLVMPNPADSGTPGTSCTKPPVIAKLSDFGYSLLVSPQQNASDSQRYHGTKAYNAPEISRDDEINWSEIDFFKCDVWALGLLCWEAIQGGKHYYENTKLLQLLSQMEGSSISSSSHGSNSAGPHSSHLKVKSLLQNLTTIQPFLGDLAREYTETSLRLHLGRYSIRLLRLLFCQTLQSNPLDRVGDVSRLSLIPGVRESVPEVRPQLIDTSAKLSEWNFENFEPRRASQIPHAAKVQMFNDSYRLASTKTSGSTAGRAMLNVALAYATGCGTNKDLKAFKEWIGKSGRAGLWIAELLGELLDRHETNDTSDQPEAGSKLYTQFIRKALLAQRSLAQTPAPIQPLSEDSPGLMTWPSLALDLVDVGAVWEYQDSKMPDGHTYGVPENSQVEREATAARPEKSNERFLAACRAGNCGDVKACLAAGADPTHSGTDNSNCLHWLFMFPEEDISRMAHDLLSATQQGVNFSETLIEAWMSQKMSPQRIDPQLPIEVGGAPHTVAIMVGSETAVRTLLEIGARFSGFFAGTWPEAKYECPLALAASLHLDGIVRVICERYTAWGLSPNYPVEKIPHDPMSFCLFEVSDFHHAVMHGSQAARVRESTIRQVLLLEADVQVDWLATNMAPPLRALAAAVATGKTELVDLLLDISASVYDDKTAPDDETQRLLQQRRLKANHMEAAVRTACSDAFTFKTGVDLIENAIRRGCSIDVAPVKHPIIDAIDHHREDLMRWLIDAGADLNIKSEGGGAPLHELLVTGFATPARIRLLVAKGAIIGSTDDTKATPLHVAVSRGLVEETSALLELGAEVNAIDVKGNRPLHRAVQTGQPAVLQAVLESKPIIDAQNADGSTALIDAARLGFPEMVKQLLEAGAQTSTQDNRGRVCLHYATLGRHSETVKALLNQERDSSFVDHLDFLGLSPLCLAIQNAPCLDDGDFLPTPYSSLLEAGASSDRALFEAVVRSNTGLVSVILGFKPSVVEFYQGSKVCTALTTAIDNCDEIIVQLLVKFGVDVNRLDLHGIGPLHRAAAGLNHSARSDPERWSRCLRITELLLANGADPGLRDQFGRTCLHHAVLPDNATVSSPGEPETTLSEPCKVSRYITTGKGVMVKVLLERGVRCDGQDDFGNTALHYAAMAVQLEAVTCLLQHTAKCDLTNLDGETPLQLAFLLESGSLPVASSMEHARREICVALLRKGAYPFVEGKRWPRLVGPRPFDKAITLPVRWHRDFLQALMLARNHHASNAALIETLEAATLMEDAGHNSIDKLAVAGTALHLWAATDSALSRPWPGFRTEGPKPTEQSDMVALFGGLLLDINLNILEKDGRGMCPLELAMAKSNDEIAQWLLEQHLFMWTNASHEPRLLDLRFGHLGQGQDYKAIRAHEPVIARAWISAIESAKWQHVELILRYHGRVNESLLDPHRLKFLEYALKGDRHDLLSAFMMRDARADPAKRASVVATSQPSQPPSSKRWTGFDGLAISKWKKSKPKGPVQELQSEHPKDTWVSPFSLSCTLALNDAWRGIMSFESVIVNAMSPMHTAPLLQLRNLQSPDQQLRERVDAFVKLCKEPAPWPNSSCNLSSLRAAVRTELVHMGSYVLGDLARASEVQSQIKRFDDVVTQPKMTVRVPKTLLDLSQDSLD